MERKSHVPETRVKIFPNVSEESTKSDGEILKINFEHLDSFDQLIPGAHMKAKTPPITTVQILSECADKSLAIQPSSDSSSPVTTGMKCVQSTPTANIPCGPRYSPPEREGLPQPLTKIPSQTQFTAVNVESICSASNDEAQEIVSRFETQCFIAPMRLSLHEPAELGRSESSSVDMPSPDELTFDSGLGENLMGDEDKLRMHAACLEGRLSTYSREAEVWLRERAELAIEVSALRKRLEVAQRNCKEVKEQCDAELDELLAKEIQFNKDLCETRRELLKQFKEKQALDEKLATVAQTASSLRNQLTTEMQKSDAKDEAIETLKLQIAHLSAEVQSFRFAHAQELESKSDLSAELASIKRSQDWCNEQLLRTQVARDRLQTELASARRWLENGNDSAQKLSIANARLETQLLSSEVALADAKRNLAHKLETIRTEIIERESMFEKFAAEKASLQSLCHHRNQQITDGQQKIAALQNNLAEAENEAAQHLAALNLLRQNLQSVDFERDSLRRCVNTLEAQLAEQKALMDVKISENDILAERLNKQELVCSQLEVKLNDELEAKATSEASFRAIQTERDELAACVNQLKDHMSAVDTKYLVLQSELEERSNQLAGVLSARDDLCSDLEVLQATLREKMKSIEALSADNDHMQSTIANIQAENEGFCEDIRKLSEALKAAEAAIESACEAAVAKAKAPLTTELNQVSAEAASLRADLQAANERAVVLLGDQERYCALITAHDELKHNYDGIVATHAAECESLAYQLREAENRFTQTLLAKSLELEALQTKLVEKTSEVLQLTSQINQAKVKHSEALSAHSSQILKLQQSLNTAEALRNELQQQLQEMLQRECVIITQHKQELAHYQETVAKLEVRAADATNLEDQNRQLISDLKASQGRELGLNDTLDGLRKHAKTLEAALSLRQADVVELAEKAETQAALLARTKNRLKVAEQCQQQTALPSGGLDFITPVQSVPMNSAPPACLECNRLSEEMKQAHQAAARLHAELLQTKTSLELSEQETTAQAARAANEALAKEEAMKSRREIAAELADFKKELVVITDQLSERNHQLQLASSDVQVLRAQANTNCSSTSAEIVALQSILQAIMNHCDLLKRKLANTQNENSSNQAALAHLQGGLRGLIERNRVFSELEYSGGTDADGAVSNSVNVRDLEVLLEGRMEESILESKPLATVCSFLNTLQREINCLEEQVIAHASVVNDTVLQWRSAENEAVMLGAQTSSQAP